MDLDKLELDLQAIVEKYDEASFIYDLLLAYGLPKSSITRLKKGDLDKSRDDAKVVWRKKLCFLHESDGELLSAIDDLQKDTAITRHRPRFIVVTNFEQLLAVDTLAKDTLDIPFDELPKHCDFFLPWAGMEKATFRSESPVDIKAAETMGKLYELILLKNPPADDEARHALNVFFVRLLFCFFAEDTGIFTDDLFTKSISQHTKEDGSSLQAHLGRLFRALDTKNKSDFPRYLQEFPYVGGTLFSDDYPVPAFNEKARQIIVDCGALDWKAINPDIFGSMMQAVTHADTRGSAGMHYTSVVNIMKVIEPLFLNDLQEALADAESNEKKLAKLLGRIYKLKVFDPACGSGNFLIIAFKELCRLEIDIFQELQEIDPGNWGLARSGIQLTQFYGIEIEDFAHETAKLSLWLAEHQMNLEFEEVFGKARPTLPLDDCGNIVCGNATRLEWSSICPNPNDVLVYLIGNPPYKGARNQNNEQKQDIRQLLGQFVGVNRLDYIACWFWKAAQYIRGTNSKCAFVSTNSLTQGEQVSLFWPHIFEMTLEIGFAFRSFNWMNNARGGAGVTCVIVGLQSVSNSPKFIHDGSLCKSVENISPYLLDSRNVFVGSRRVALSRLPVMAYGNPSVDGGYLKLNKGEKEELLLQEPRATKFLRRIIGAEEYVDGLERWCIWIEDEDLEEALLINPIRKRVDQVRAFREAGGDTARSLVDRPHQFRYRHVATRSMMLVPQTTTEARNYLPIGFVDKNYIALQTAQLVYDPPVWVFAVVSSRMHMVWVQAVGGRFRNGYRYSNVLCYNTFPIPSLSKASKALLEESAFGVLDARERYPEKTPAQLYDPKMMPKELLQAHKRLDESIDACYRKTPFESDVERLAILFDLYEAMIEKESEEVL